MVLNDIGIIGYWWLLLFSIGLIFFPLAANVFAQFWDKGYAFGKILGILMTTYVVFVLGILHVFTFSKLLILIVLLACFTTTILLFRKTQKKDSLLSLYKRQWKIILFEELLLLSFLLFFGLIRGTAPDIHGLEKYMDFGFINSIIRSEHFPPRDMWFTPLSINYYYFGHLTTATLTKLSGIPANITYNLMLATIFSFAIVATFSLVTTLLTVFFNDAVSLGKKQYDSIQKRVFTFLGAVVGSFLLVFGGNLHPIYTLFKPYQNDNPVPFWQLAFSPSTFPNGYWYPNATRFIQNTIHEFPIYSFAVSDLHGHVLAIPIVLTSIALLLSLMLGLWQKRSVLTVLLLSFLISVSYMTDALGGVIYILLSAVVIAFLEWERVQNRNTTNNPILKILPINTKMKQKILNNWFIDWVIGLFVYLFILILGFSIFTFPFSLHFKPFVSGVGVICAPEVLTNIGKIGPLLFEKDHCQRSPIWQMLILHGFWYFWIISFLVFLLRKDKSTHSSQNKKQRSLYLYLKNLDFIENFKLKIENLPRPDIFVLLLILVATILIIVPEFLYAKDIYPAHYRANTMFKLGYQAFIMLAISTAYIMIRLASSIHPLGLWKNTKKRVLTTCYALLALCLFSLVGIYPHYAISSYYGNLQTYHGLDGTKYLNVLYPTDYEAIQWINENIQGQPVILEAQGDSYTDYARISSNTGLPTVLGWTVHEWLWRGSYDIPSPRIAEVQSLYESTDREATKALLKKYHVEYVFIGSMETQKYPALQEQKFTQLGKLIHQNGATKIYKIN